MPILTIKNDLDVLNSMGIVCQAIEVSLLNI